MQSSPSLDNHKVESSSLEKHNFKQDEKLNDANKAGIPFIIQFPKKNLNSSFIPVSNCMMKNRKKKCSNIKQSVMYCVPSFNQQIPCFMNKTKSKMNGNIKKNAIKYDQCLNMKGKMCMNAGFNTPYYCFAKKSRVPFTPEEDEKIKELAEKYGNRQWPLIASFLPGRTSKQCRDRYSNYLVPGYFKGEWSKEEDELLTKLFNENGPKWSILQKSFPGRSANSIKNRWNYFLCRQEKIEINDEDIISENKSKMFKDEDEASDKSDDLDSSLLFKNDDDSFLFQNDDTCNDALIHEIGSMNDVLKEGNDEAFCFIEQENEMLEILNNNMNGYENEWSIFN